MNASSTPHLVEDVRDLLCSGVGEVFNTMLTLEAAPVEVVDLQASGEALVTASVGFIGAVNGVVYLHVTAAFARKLAGCMLGMADEEFDGDEMINDAMGELGNMVVGAVKSRLCDEGSSCVLTIPSIVRGRGFSVGAAGCSDRRLLGFRCGDGDLVVELSMKSSAI